MLGIFLIFILYGIVLIICSISKYLLNNYIENKKGEEKPSTPKIYYINNTTKSPPKKTKTDIAVKGRIIEKDNFN